MIESRVETDGSVRVTFRLPNTNGAERISVVGEFNAWCPTANMMHREGDELVTHIKVQPGRAYRFRYLLDDEHWQNDWAADDYLPNEFGGDDSVLDLTQPTSAHPTHHAAPRESGTPRAGYRNMACRTRQQSPIGGRSPIGGDDLQRAEQRKSR